MDPGGLPRETHRSTLRRPLVTSFSGKYGGIRYCVRAVLERPAAPEQSVRRELQVVSHIDVNTPALLVSARRLSLCPSVLPPGRR